MERTRLLELFDAYLDQRMSAADRAALSSELVSSPEACRLFWEYAHQHALLADLLAEARGLELAQQEPCGTCPPLTPLPLTRPAAGPPAGLPERPRPIGPRDRGRARSAGQVVRWSAVAAAALLIALGVGWLTRHGGEVDRSSDPILARLGELKGDVHVLVGEGLLPARAGQVIRSGEEIRTGEDSSVVVTYADESRLELNADTAVRLLGNGRATQSKRVFLVHGVLNATVTAQPEGRPLRFSTDEADLIVPGTRFSAAGILGETRIEMEEGKALLARKGDIRSIEVSTGTYAISAPDMEVYSPTTLVPASSTPFATLQEKTGPVLALAAVFGGEHLAVGCGNGQVKLWDIRSRKVRGTLDAGKVRVHALAASPDGRSLAVGYECPRREPREREPALWVWDLVRRDARVLPAPNRVTAVSFLPDARSLALIGDKNRGVLLWDLPEGGNAPADRRERLQLGDRIDRAECLAVSPDGRLVAAGYRDGRIRLWDTLTGRIDRIFEGHRREVQSLAFQPGGDVLASGSRDGTVRLWSLDTGDELKSLTGPFNEVRCLTFSPDGRTLATGHAGIAVLWSVRTGEKRSTLRAHKFAITSLVYLDDGRTLASAGWDRTVKLWKLEPAEEPRH